MSHRELLKSMHAPRWEPRRRSLVIEAPAVLMLVSMVVLAVVLFVLNLRGLSFVALVLTLMAIQVGITLHTTRSVRAFDAQFMRLLQRNDVTGLDALWAKSWFVRGFAPSGFVANRRGILSMLRGDYVDAERDLERAWTRTHPLSRHSLVPALCRTKYRVRSLQDMRDLAEDWERQAGSSGPSRWYLALGRLESEGLSDEALEELLVGAGTPEDPIDEAVRAEVFALRARRVSPGDNAAETGPFAAPTMDVPTTDGFRVEDVKAAATR